MKIGEQMGDAMLQKQQLSSDTAIAESATTRRALMARNIKAIGALTASAVVARLLAPTKAFAIAPPPCFLKGTRIQTIRGERNVEELSVGDVLPTVHAGTQPIEWIARVRRTRETGQAWKKHAMPIRIKRSALAPDVPHRDLYVTPEHAVFVDGVLVTAGRLVNGTTIAPHIDADCGALEFFHIKLATHDVVCAEGAPCETLLRVEETVSNFAEYLRMYGVAATPEVPCAPIYGRGARTEIGARLRSLLSSEPALPTIDAICDRLEKRALIVY
jgi:Hint domain